MTGRSGTARRSGTTGLDELPDEAGKNASVRSIHKGGEQVGDRLVIGELAYLTNEFCSGTTIHLAQPGPTKSLVSVLGASCVGKSLTESSSREKCGP